MVAVPKAATCRSALLAMMFTAVVSVVPAPAAAQSVSRVDDAVRAGIERGIYPGAVVIIGRRDSLLYARGYGHFTWDTRSPVPTADSTVWDLASITKIVSTMSAAMKLVDEGKLDLEAPVSKYLPRFTGGLKKRVTVRMLLDHTSGLKSYVPIYQAARTKSKATSLLYAQPLLRTPGDSAVYSDLNALLLGLVVEKVTGASIDRFARREVFEPLGMEQTMFKPPKKLRKRMAPSGLWRGQPVAGEVNDQNAVAFGGVAGHAGLFSTGADLARYAQAWLRGGMGPQERWVGFQTMARFLSHGTNTGSRLLGWDTRERVEGEPSVFGDLTSDATYGHTGFTGTLLWVDPPRDLFLVFLTNRTFDPRVPESIKELKAVRAAVSDAAVRLVPHGCGQELISKC
jgi:CubicO group peptidase (beta-lactamase class C family)